MSLLEETLSPNARHASAALEEANRVMTVCNSCRYCEGLCAVFPAMELHRSFEDGDLNYLANLCHECGACYSDCQFSPPHEFMIDVPKTLAVVRRESYATYVWPSAFQFVFERNGLMVSIVMAISVTLFLLSLVLIHDSSKLFAVQTGAGAFYVLMPHGVMTSLFIAVTLYAILAFLMGLRAFWRDIGGPSPWRIGPNAWWEAFRDAATLRYLDGGKTCDTDDDKPKDRRRLYHHLTFYGFLLCYGSTLSATGYHYLLGLRAPYPWYDLPVVLGTLGGIGLLIGPIGLLAQKFKRGMVDPPRFGMDTGFLAMLFLSGLSGLALLVFRETAAMGLLLATHLGIIFALFVTLPYGKFVHAIYRVAALVHSALERPAEYRRGVGGDRPGGARRCAAREGARQGVASDVGFVSDKA